MIEFHRIVPCSSLGPLVKKVKEFQIEQVVTTLCTNMASQDEQLRDISSIGLKTVINELPVTSTSLVEAVCKNITQRISSVILKVRTKNLFFFYSDQYIPFPE